MQMYAENLRASGQRIGVVPTMGYLHDGHMSLLHTAKKHAEVIIMTIFVNPMQFGPNEDYQNYPRDEARDRLLAEAAGCDILFIPEAGSLYPEGFKTHVEVETITTILEGAIRPTHFRGVTTIVTKLLHITKPHVVVFGQKDAQQVSVIRQMIRDLNFDITVIVAPTVREADGLAMSSRNIYLSERERHDALLLSQSLFAAEQRIRSGERDAATVERFMNTMISSSPSVQLDYISIVDEASLAPIFHIMEDRRTLIAVAARVGKTRLIDNIIIDFRKDDHE